MVLEVRYIDFYREQSFFAISLVIGGSRLRLHAGKHANKAVRNLCKNIFRTIYIIKVTLFDTACLIGREGHNIRVTLKQAILT